MTMNYGQIRPGCTVYDAGGAEVGRVIRVESLPAGEDAGGVSSPDVLFNKPARGDQGVGPMPERTGLTGPPLGTTTDKGRGSTASAGLAAERADLPSGAVGRGVDPAHGGLNSTETAPEETTAATPLLDADTAGGDMGSSGSARGTAGGGGGHQPGTFSVEDPGVLGVGARVLHIPFADVTEASGGRIVLAVSREEAARRYGPGPSLDLDENARVLPY